MTKTTDKANQSFERYAAALLARDETAMAGRYAIPSLILFPGNSIAVSDARQTEEFFAACWEQYEGVDSVDQQVVIMGEAPGSVWADVTWSFQGQPPRALLLSAHRRDRRIPSRGAHPDGAGASRILMKRSSRIKHHPLPAA